MVCLFPRSPYIQIPMKEKHPNKNTILFHACNMQNCKKAKPLTQKTLTVRWVVQKVQAFPSEKCECVFNGFWKQRWLVTTSFLSSLGEKEGITRGREDARRQRVTLTLILDHLVWKTKSVKLRWKKIRSIFSVTVFTVLETRVETTSSLSSLGVRV